jgi:hypothetical protein
VDEPHFAARVEDILRAEELLAAYADGDLDAIMANLIDLDNDDPFEALVAMVQQSNQTILALLLIGHVAIRELADQMKREVPELRKFLRVFILEKAEEATR